MKGDERRNGLRYEQLYILEVRLEVIKDQHKITIKLQSSLHNKLSLLLITFIYYKKKKIKKGFTIEKTTHPYTQQNLISLTKSASK